MKRNILVATVISGLILLVGLSFQLGRSAGIHGSETALQTSETHVGGEVHTDEAMDPNMPGMDHSAPTATDEEAMDPDMPGMDHSDPTAVDPVVNRPLKETLGAFGVATSIVLSGALILRRRDKNQRELKVNARKNSGEVL